MLYLLHASNGSEVWRHKAQAQVRGVSLSADNATAFLAVGLPDGDGWVEAVRTAAEQRRAPCNDTEGPINP